ncbi:MAG: hypothetical protein ACXVYY_17210 [Oryzihumus sp.]
MMEHPGDPSRVATILPGRAYAPGFPLLRYCVMLLVHRGWSVREVCWEHGDRATPDQAARESARALDQVSARQHLVVAKSLGGSALPYAVERGLPGVWLTPVLTVPAVAEAVARLTAPSLVVGGTADQFWDSHADIGPGARVLELSGADHALEHGTDVHRALGTLRQVVDTVTTFLDELDGGSNAY